MSPRLVKEIEQAFARGPGFGLLHLGAAVQDENLPPGLQFLRELGVEFMRRLCAVPDLEEKRAEVRVPAPDAVIAELVSRVPPMTGAEYVDEPLLESFWQGVGEAFAYEISAFDGPVQQYLRSFGSVWTVLGKVCFHLAENKRDRTHPFAFMATYASRLAGGDRVRHLPLGRALEQYSGEGDRESLLSLLVPVRRAAERLDWVRDLVESRAVFQPLAWTPAQAHGLLVDIPELESCGLVVRVPDWWNSARPARPRVNVSVGQRPPSSLGQDALLDFSVSLAVDGEPLTDAELKALLGCEGGLVSLKGKWVEVDPERLAELLDHFSTVQDLTRDGMGFAEGMRMLSGFELAASGPEGVDDGWSEVTAGDWLGRALDGLRSPDRLKTVRPGRALHAKLRPYQEQGVRWLALLDELGLGGCLADDMGLGKTIQVIALLLLHRRSKAGPGLVVVPASLVTNWKAEIERFAPSLRTLVAHSSDMPRDELVALDPEEAARHDVVITSYGSLLRLPWLVEVPWRVVALDEAQAIKNPAAKQTRAAKALQARTRLALTGTPLENRLSDLWSLFDFINPGLLGSAAEFTRHTKALSESGRYGPLRSLVAPYVLRRLKTDRSVIDDLPDKTEVKAYCHLSRKQAVLYKKAVDELAAALEADDADGIQRRGLVLAFLLRFKQICNHPSHWLGDGGWEPARSGKLLRLGEICEEVASRGRKVLVFTQFRQVTAPLADFLATVFGRPGLLLHGGTPVRKRKPLVDDFQSETGPPFMVLSLKAGGTGLNLTAASHVVHFDRWWNPAVEDQATDRAFRIGQKRNVLVHKLICTGTIEERVDELIESKKHLSREVLAAGSEPPLTELSDAELMDLVSLDISRAVGE
jgi:non-specific serine/threonine protein kinase